MAFVLRVTHGAGEGESLSVETEARLGRTADNDLVIKDPSSSRSHARVFEKNGRYYVEDLKSQNGTLLNKVALKTARALNDGDQIAIGDVVVEFSLVVAEQTAEPVDANATMMQAPSATVDTGSEPDAPEEEPEADPNATLLKPPRGSKPISGRRPGVRRPTPVPEEEEEPAEDLSDSTKNFEVPPPRALQRRTGAANVPVRASRATDDVPDEMTAAERARNRRELGKSATGRVQLLWQQMSKPVRIIVSIVLSVFGLALVGGMIFVAMPRKVQKKIEPSDLRANSEPVTDSFGAGDDVDFQRPDMKSFSFTYNAPTRVVGVLHYQARGISKGEVSIELNGTDLGSVPADLLDTDTRELNAVLPSTAMKVGEPNELVFDNVNNPPGDEPWRVWNIWVELIPTPEMNAEEASRRAKEDMDKANKYYDQRDIGAENLFRAWKTYRDAWLLLEATPDRPEDLYKIARTRMLEIRPELDRKCSAMLVEYKKVMNLKIPDTMRARKLLEDIPTYFPTKEHPCHNLSRALLRDLEDLQEAPPAR